ncbi:uncharacterized protein LOC101746987 [Bombyx mori]|uniref:Uncharacterized protein n=1 Tax=Bombyx mori TaxID=7091 RepID=A0A8R2ALF5_BOMMO|nr:uncharacterized protein LOC101746987 [Bombyx mori]
MAPIYLIFGLIVQSSIIFADEETTVSIEELPITENIESSNIHENQTEFDDEVTKDEGKQDWMDFFLGPNSDLYPTSSVAMMNQATQSDKPIEEQLEDIKIAANKITQAIQSEMANLLTYALNTYEKEHEDNNLRKKRSTETPVDSSQLIMRLLKHIKATNEFQNIAIDKMMTAQQIADKFGIEFNPDPEILTDLAVATNKNTNDLASMLSEVCDLSKNKTCHNISLDQEDEDEIEMPIDNSTYYVYALYYPDDDDNYTQPPYEFVPQTSSPTTPNNYPYETQIRSPLSEREHSKAPVSQKPSFYEAISMLRECSMEPFSDPEPELVGEVYEESVSNKVIVEKGDEPGAATVNHIMTYSVSEKSHYKTPQIERLPQQMQYYFYLI